MCLMYYFHLYCWVSILANFWKGYLKIISLVTTLLNSVTYLRSIGYKLIPHHYHSIYSFTWPCGIFLKFLTSVYPSVTHPLLCNIHKNVWNACTSQLQVANNTSYSLHFPNVTVKSPTWNQTSSILIQFLTHKNLN